MYFSKEKPTWLQLTLDATIYLMVVFAAFYVTRTELMRNIIGVVDQWFIIGCLVVPFILAGIFRLVGLINPADKEMKGKLSRAGVWTILGFAGLIIGCIMAREVADSFFKISAHSFTGGTITAILFTFFSRWRYFALGTRLRNQL
jgi:hypothetical protein